ncbi:MAG TPA: TMEM175 family protein [Pyrinomonadaceae bacterium]
MIREKLVEKSVGAQTGFRWRGHEVSRLEGLADAVFGFAITLLVVSLEVPKTFTELVGMMNGLGAFAISFLMLFVVWFNHYRFFRRYGLQDNVTIWLNAILLFVILFYVYPLKFLFTWLLNMFTGGHGMTQLADGTTAKMVENEQTATLMIIFGVGYVAAFLIFVLLYWHAYRKRVELELNELERFDTRNEMQESGINVVIGLISLALASIGGPRYASMAGIVYLLLGPAMGIHGFMMGARRRKLEKRFTVEAAAA